MSRVLKISDGDYKVKVRTSGTIILDTSPDPTAPAFGQPGYTATKQGKVIITGNLEVQGETTTINTTQMTIEDRIITLNSGDTGASGITSVGGYKRSGIEINRGTNTNNYPKAQFLFDETVPHYDSLLDNTINGTFVLRTDDNSYTGLRLASVGAPPGLDFAFDFSNYNQVLKIVNTDAEQYATLLEPGGSLPSITDTPEDNFIPNKKYVSKYVSASGGTANVDNFHYLANPGYTRGTAHQNYIDFKVATIERARINTSGLFVDNINIFHDTITNVGSSFDGETTYSDNLIITSANSTVEIDGVLQIDDTTGPTAVSGATKIYTLNSSSTGPGKTGVYFTSLGNSDELVAKNRALLFSILF